MKPITHKTYCKKEVFSCDVNNSQVVPEFIDMVSVVTRRCKNT